MKTGKMKTSKMKTSINLKTRKMKNNYLKLGMMAAVMLSASIGFAQTTDATDGSLNNVFGTGQSIKVIDNKGTIKYLQTNNGITSITSSSGGSKTTTTWQLGGALVANTNIATGDKDFKLTINDGTNQGSFIIDGVELATGAASTDATTGSIGGTGTGYTFLVRDEVTGQTKKLLASDLITGIRQEYSQAADATGNVAITVTGLPVLVSATSAAKLSVYRNGVKLRFGEDFVAIVDLVTITYDAVNLPMYENDIIEIQYLK